MNTEICHFFNSVKNHAFLHDQPFSVLLANDACYREAGVAAAEALGVAMHGQHAQAKSHEVIS